MMLASTTKIVQLGSSYTGCSESGAPKALFERCVCPTSAIRR